jgi:DNA-binding transcriptional LysR family regulator
MREKLTLIPAFDAIMSEGSLVRAATRLGVTQSAVSQALARLRRLANDPLFESMGRGMRPTPRALEMASHLQLALSHVDAAFSPKVVDISSLHRTFVIDIGGGFDALIVPPLLTVLESEAPGVRLLVSNARGGDLLSELRFGETELAFDFQPTTSDGIRCERLGGDSAVVLARQDHPRLKNGLTRKEFMSLSHVALVWTRAAASSGVSLELARMGLEVKIAVSVPTVTALGNVVAASDFIATASGFTARGLASHYRLKIHPMPFRLPRIVLYLLWHSRFDDDEGHRWLRGTINKLAQQIVPSEK